ncbi:MAG: hypothetical protein JHD17_01845 [Acidimicrobiia bacterium]|nr:hypothetical protein [Acidimicrobiia bacterium]
MNAISEPASTNNQKILSWPSITRGALAGLAIVVVAAIARAVLNNQMDDFKKSIWVYLLFVVVLVGYFVAGYVAGRARPDTPLANGALAGLGAVVLWIPIRVVIWAVREDGHALLKGNQAILRPGQIFGALVISTALGMVGALIAARRSRTTT